ncbi:DUF6474 family protein [Corynebacterium sphenisci]|nr:DUF6474 family protein [Corynebacterium sphenisci]
MMSFLGDIRDRRREGRLALKAARTKAKEDARHEAKLKRRALKQGRKEEARRLKAETRATERGARRAAKRDRSALKHLDKIHAKQAKQEAKAAKAKRRHQTKLAEKVLEQQRQAGFGKEKAKSWIGGGRLLLPVLVPLAYRGVTWLQNRGQESEARRLGVTADAVARHPGNGAPLLARIDAVRDAVDRLRSSGLAGAVGFASDADDRLDVLVDGVKNAEHLPPRQRRRAHDSIAAELDGLDSEIMDRLGIRA